MPKGFSHVINNEDLGLSNTLCVRILKLHIPVISKGKFCLVWTRELSSNFCRSNSRTWLFGNYPPRVQPVFGNMRARVWDSIHSMISQWLFLQSFMLVSKATLAEGSFLPNLVIKLSQVIIHMLSLRTVLFLKSI